MYVITDKWLNPRLLAPLLGEYYGKTSKNFPEVDQSGSILYPEKRFNT